MGVVAGSSPVLPVFYVRGIMHKCVLGLVGGKFVKEGNWFLAVEKFKEKIDRFNNSRKAIPHPGRIIEFKYCPVCGARVGD